jgi:serine/threonine-protein kinase RsbT
MSVVQEEVRVLVRAETDILSARQRGRELATELGFAGSELAVIATAISEVARNIVLHASEGEIILSPAVEGKRRGLLIIARDTGPGIPDVDRALEDGFSTVRSLGLGLPGAKRLTDEFDIESVVGEGTIVTMTKWRR